jgi:hypothetical protein
MCGPACSKVRKFNFESESFSFSDGLLVEHVQVQSTVQALSTKQGQYVTKTYFPVTCSEDAEVK